MSKRNLARTAIEGGRSKHTRYEEHQTTKKERAMVHARLRKVLFDRDYADEVIIEPRYAMIPWIDNDFDDKISPVRRWLGKQVGRVWNDVYSEIKKTFDPRTTAGRHILYDHILGMVYHPWDHHRLPYRNEFLVGEDGILRRYEAKEPWYYRYRFSPSFRYRQSTPVVNEFLRNRYVGLRGSIYFWFIPQYVDYRFCEKQNDPWYRARTCPRDHQYRWQYGKDHRGNQKVETLSFCKQPKPDENGKIHCRQDRPLTEEEVAFWKQMHEDLQENVTYDAEG